VHGELGLRQLSARPAVAETQLAFLSAHGADSAAPCRAQVTALRRPPQATRLPLIMLGWMRCFRRLGFKMAVLAVGAVSAACGGKDAPDNGRSGVELGGAASTSDATPGGAGASIGTASTSDATGGGAEATIGTASRVSAEGGSVNTTLAAAVGGVTNATASTQAAGLNCKDAVCPSIPSACTKFVQPAGECCTKCAYDPCAECPALTCPVGQHPETPAGACCPACTADPPSACEKGRADYLAERAVLVDKYSSPGCRGASECSIVAEQNQCAWTCGIPLPALTVSNLTSNLLSRADTICASCAAPPVLLCERMVPGCVNGKCVAAEPQ
jgi:hypothetical protein